jgi:hypothetical protein
MRKETWEIDLMAFIKSRENTPFKWGSQDCVMFAVGCAQVMLGKDLSENYSYTSEKKAKTIINKAGSLRDLVTLNVGPEISPKMARRGDWVLIETAGEQALAVCLGTMLIAAGQNGLSRRPMSHAITAWRID